MSQMYFLSFKFGGDVHTITGSKEALDDVHRIFTWEYDKRQKGEATWNLWWVSDVMMCIPDLPIPISTPYPHMIPWELIHAQEEIDKKKGVDNAKDK